MRSTTDPITPTYPFGSLPADPNLQTHPGLTVVQTHHRDVHMRYTAMSAGLYATADRDVIVIAPDGELLERDGELDIALRDAARAVPAINDRVHVVADDRLQARGRNARRYILDALGPIVDAAAELERSAPPVFALPLAHLIDDNQLPEVLAQLSTFGRQLTYAPMLTPVGQLHTEPASPRPDTRTIITTSVPMERMRTRVLADADLVLATRPAEHDLRWLDLHVSKYRGVVPNDCGWVQV